MSNKKLLRVVEQQEIAVTDPLRKSGLSWHEYTLLEKYGEKTNHRLFTIYGKRIKFHQYVGVFRAGHLTVEVLPKTVNANSDRKIARSNFYRLLSLARKWQRGLPGSRSPLAVNPELPVDEQVCAELLDSGSFTQPGEEITETSCYGGSVLFNRQFRKVPPNNLRWTVRKHHTNEQRAVNHWLSSILRLIGSESRTEQFRERARHLQGFFPEPMEKAAFLQYRVPVNLPPVYRPVLARAGKLASVYRPGCQGDGEGLMYDMNQLFEAAVTNLLKQALPEKWVIQVKPTYPFWGEQELQPDIMISTPGQTIVLDCKWKKLPENRVDNDDLRQIYTYCKFSGASKGILVYPSTGKATGFSYPFKPEALSESGPVACEVKLINLFKIPDKQIAQFIFTELFVQDQHP
jgi:5-methylcytosine-specific restriction enzyme subunit McrC